MGFSHLLLNVFDPSLRQWRIQWGLPMMATTILNPRLFQTWELCLSSPGCCFVCPFPSGTPVWIPLLLGFRWQFYESVFATCSAVGSLFSVHAQSCVNKHKPLGRLWQSRWFEQHPVSRIPGCWWGKSFSPCAFSKPLVLCCHSVRLMALLSLCRVFNFGGFSVIPQHSSSSKNTWEAFAVLMASGNPKTQHVTFPFLS